MRGGGGRGTRRGLVVAAAAGALVLALAGCQTGKDDGAGAGSGGGVGDAAEVSGDGSTLVLQLHAAGGFVPWGYDFANVPEVSVYADGTAVVHGPMTLQYPGAALPNLQTLQLPDGVLDELVAAAAQAGLLAPPPEYGQPGVTDLPSTHVTIAVGGETFEHVAYALGAGPGEDGPDSEGMFGGGASGLTEEQSAARQALGAFVRQVRDAVGAGGEEQYVPTAFGVLAMAQDPAATADVEGLDGGVLPWPVGGGLADAGECLLVDGEDAATLLATLAEANELTRFEQDGVTYDVFVRPLLPHESSCADLAR